MKISNEELLRYHRDKYYGDESIREYILANEAWILNDTEVGEEPVEDGEEEVEENKSDELQFSLNSLELDVESLEPTGETTEETKEFIRQQNMHKLRFLSEIKSKGLTLNHGLITGIKGEVIEAEVIEEVSKPRPKPLNY